MSRRLAPSRSAARRALSLGVCAGVSIASVAIAAPVAHASAARSWIAHEGSSVKPAGAGELSASFTLAATTAQRATIKHLAGARQSHGRLAAFRAAEPAAAHRDAVVAWAAAQGFRVVHSSRFVVTVVGPSDALATALGTSLHTVTFHGKTFSRSISAPQVPATLLADAQSVIGLDNRPVFHAHDFGPTEVRAMSVEPAQGSTAGTGVTIGTVNFSGWTSSDLTNYGVDPYQDSTNESITTAGKITEVALNGFNTVGDNNTGGGVEVALDAEAILAAAPGAKQRLYFADNTSSGYLAILDQMATDATSADVTRRLQVASSSWGGCELDQAPSIMNALGARIDTLVAAGVTFFAASGDSGSYDCSVSAHPDNRLAVDFPASWPNTVAVGGTTVSQPTATTFTNAAWGNATASDGTASTAYQGDGGGGGFSSLYNAPSYQPIPTPASTSTPPRRRVPDIAALADPTTGFIGFVTTDFGRGFEEGGATLLGGTSLAAPLSAAGLATVLAGTSTPGTGLGNILSLIYGHPEVTHDVVGGSNGFYPAIEGFDAATGLGTMDWAAFAQVLNTPDPSFTVAQYTSATAVPVSIGGLASNFASWSLTDGGAPGCAGNVPGSTKPTSVTISTTQGAHTLTLNALDRHDVCHTVSRSVFLDTVAPVVTGLHNTYTGTTTPTDTIAWGGSETGSGLASYDVTIHDNNTGGTVLHQLTLATSRAQNTGLTPGHTYKVSVFAMDRAGNVGPTAITSFVTPTDDKAFIKSGMTTVSNASDYMKAHATSSKAGTYAKFTFTGKTASVGFLRNASSGFVDIYVDGVKKSRMNLYSSATKYRASMRVATFTTSGKHTVMLKVVGAHQSGAKGSQVNPDALYIGN